MHSHINNNSNEGATIHNIRLDNHFTITANSTPEDPNLSWAAKGLLWYILSRPSDWKIHSWQLADVYAGDKKGNKLDAVKEIIKELKNAGYVKYTKSKDSMGKWQHRYDVYPMPMPAFQKIIPEGDFPQMDNPSVLTSTELPRKDIDIDIIIAPTQPPKIPKAQVMPAGGNNKALDIQEIFECLEQCDDLSPRQKRVLSKHPEAIVRDAVKYAYHPSTVIEGGPIGRMKLLQYFCNNPEDFKDTVQSLDRPKETRTKKEILMDSFKKGETYNGYEFFKDDYGCGFTASSGHTYFVEFKSLKFEQQWKELLEKLGLDKM